MSASNLVIIYKILFYLNPLFCILRSIHSPLIILTYKNWLNKYNQVKHLSSFFLSWMSNHLIP